MPIHPLIKNKPIKVDTYDELVKLEIWNQKDVCIMLKLTGELWNLWFGKSP
jgi:hypothetical protein